METIRGRRSFDLDGSDLQKKISGYAGVLLDLGTGDGRFVQAMARQQPARFFIGIDACRENLHARSLKSLPNALYLIAGAESIPPELKGLAAKITINFPWGSLLAGLLKNHSGMAAGLTRLARAGSELEVHLNAEALLSAGSDLETGPDLIRDVLESAGWSLRSRASLDADALRALPTTWAKRLAYGRDPRAVRLRLVRNP